MHAGPCGAGHFVKMVHNGIEYGLMQAYAEGFDILRNANSRSVAPGIPFRHDLADIAEVWRRGSVVSSWLLDLTATRSPQEERLDILFRLPRGFRRRPLDLAGRDRGGGARRSAVGRPVHALPLAPEPHLRREDHLGDAQGLRRACRAEGGEVGAYPARGREWARGLCVQSTPRPARPRRLGVDFSSKSSDINVSRVIFCNFVTPKAPFPFVPSPLSSVIARLGR